MGLASITMSALVPSADALITLMRLPLVSETKMSPLGAILMTRGPLRSPAKTSALKCGGSLSWAPAGLSTSRGKFVAEGVS